jgi:hypothetical protein
MLKQIASVGMLLAAGSGLLVADFSYEQTTRMTGGMAAGLMGTLARGSKEPTRSTTFIKGDRSARIDADSVQITDLARETVTHVDLKKKTYSVITFEEMRQAREKAMQRAQAEQQKHATEKKPDVDVSFKASVKETGEKKPIGGFDCRQVILTLAVEGTDRQSGGIGSTDFVSDMWLTPSIPGYEEVVKFHQRMAEKSDWTPGSSAIGQGNPQMTKAFADLAKEAAKLKGVPLLQIVRMGGSAEGVPVEESSKGAQSPQQQQEATSVKEALGRLGGFGGFGRKKKKPEPETAGQAQQAPATASMSVTLMEVTTEWSGFSTAAVDEGKFQVPPGFKQVESDLAKYLK